MRITYVGGAPAVDLPLPDGRAVTVARGEAVEVADEQGASLLTQPDNWQPATPDEPAPAKKKGGKG